MKRAMFLLGCIGPLILLLGAGARETSPGEPAKPQFTLKLMGINRTVPQYRVWEELGQAVEKRTDGRVKFQFTSLPELGLGGAETIRITKTGIVDIAEFYLGYVAGELPMVEMLEIPGLFPDENAMKQAYAAWNPHLVKLIDEKVNGVLLATAFASDQFLFSKKPVRKLADFKGLKGRVHSVAIAQLLAGLGGVPLTIAFAEVYTGLERGTLDAGFTASFAGHAQKWYEVTKYLVGPVTQVVQLPLVINKNTWKKLPPDVQKILKEEAERLIDARAFELRELWHREGVEGSLAKGMEHIPFTPEIHAAIKEVLRTQVVPSWVKRAGGQEAAQLFNQIVAPLSGFTVAP
ncbi:MAG: TRAP transporter substrate-binding protein DctP [Nitrospinae bacterium]|nr:TRAP transporter substrate-binding protein DctP [Nitrospinota bacterium]